MLDFTMFVITTSERLHIGCKFNHRSTRERKEQRELVLVFRKNIVAKDGTDRTNLSCEAEEGTIPQKVIASFMHVTLCYSMSSH